MEVYLKATRPIRAELNPFLSPLPHPPPPLSQSSELDADKSQVFHPFPPWIFSGFLDNSPVPHQVGEGHCES